MASELAAQFEVLALGDFESAAQVGDLRDRLVSYAADPVVLWVVDDGANQSKGDRGPEVWRPEEPVVSCTYARRWTSIKVAYGLTATTAERVALGQMLECESAEEGRSWSERP